MSKDPLLTHLVNQRKSLGITQIQLAERMGTNRYQILIFENGQKPYTLDFLRSYASALGLKTVVVFQDA